MYFATTSSAACTNIECGRGKQLVHKNDVMMMIKSCANSLHNSIIKIDDSQFTFLAIYSCYCVAQYAIAVHLLSLSLREKVVDSGEVRRSANRIKQKSS